MPMSTKLGRVVTFHEGLSRIKSHGTLKSRGKLKTYLQYQSGYGHQTWQDGNLSWWTPTHKVTWQFDHVVL